jgi:hypothetical protein
MRALLLSLCLALGLSGCACTRPGAAEPPAPVVVRGKVTDLAAFEAFIATRPTPAQFRATYPDVLLVLPGDIATKELRLDNSRYFATLDAEGRISGGRFS